MPVCRCPFYAPNHVAYAVGQADAQPRLEIRELQTKTEQWTLFIFAMADIQLPEHRPKPLRFGDLGQFHSATFSLSSHFISSQGESMACRMSVGREYCFAEFLVSHLIAVVAVIQLLPINNQREVGEVCGLRHPSTRILLTFSSHSGYCNHGCMSTFVVLSPETS